MKSAQTRESNLKNMNHKEEIKGKRDQHDHRERQENLKTQTWTKRHRPNHTRGQSADKEQLIISVYLRPGLTWEWRDREQK